MKRIITNCFIYLAVISTALFAISVSIIYNIILIPFKIVKKIIHG